jgi:hypothetical protein
VGIGLGVEQAQQFVDAGATGDDELAGEDQAGWQESGGGNDLGN